MCARPRSVDLHVGAKLAIEMMKQGVDGVRHAGAQRAKRDAIDAPHQPLQVLQIICGRGMLRETGEDFQQPITAEPAGHATAA